MPSTDWSTSSAGRAHRRDDEIVRLLGRARRPRRWRCAATGWPRPSPTSTPPPSRPRTGSASRSSTAWARPATSSATSRSSRTCATCWTRWSTTSTCASSPAGRTRPISPARTAHGDRPQGPGPPRRRIVPAALATATTSSRRAGASPRRCATRWTAASGRQDPHLRRRAPPPARHAGRPGRGTGGVRTAARPLRRRPGRRVPGHRPGAVGHHAPAFGAGGSTLVLIGDPKQAIYAFRGADVLAYLDASRTVQLGVDARRELAQRPRPARRLRRAVRRRAARPGGHHLPPLRAAAPATSSPARRRARVRAPAGPGACTPPTASSRHVPRAASRRPTRASSSPPTWPRDGRALLEAGPEVVTRRRDGAEAGADHAAPRRHRRAGADQPPGDDGARRPAAAGVPAVIGGAGRSSPRAGAGVAAPARGARTARRRVTGPRPP